MMILSKQFFAFIVAVVIAAGPASAHITHWVAHLQQNNHLPFSHDVHDHHHHHHHDHHHHGHDHHEHASDEHHSVPLVEEIPGVVNHRVKAPLDDSFQNFVSELIVVEDSKVFLESTGLQQPHAPPGDLKPLFLISSVVSHGPPCV